MPTVTLSPDCYTMTWAFHRTSDDQDMVSLSPSVFSITATDLVVTLDAIADFALRLSYFGSDSYYLVGTANDGAST